MQGVVCLLLYVLRWKVRVSRLRLDRHVACATCNPCLLLNKSFSRLASTISRILENEGDMFSQSLVEIMPLHTDKRCTRVHTQSLYGLGCLSSISLGYRGSARQKSSVPWETAATHKYNLYTELQDVPFNCRSDISTSPLPSYNSPGDFRKC